jgi:glycosyltransferase involved in cell wall biosynthesis
MNSKTNPQEAVVSVLIPTYNRPEYLQQAIESAVKQTYRHIEIIVSDNCSPENPQALVESFNDPRIKFYRNSTNLGLVTNVLTCLRMARGKYVATLLDDDIWHEDFLANLVPPLEANPDLTIAFCDHYIVDENSKINDAETEKCTHIYKRDGLKEGIYKPFYDLAVVHQAVSPGIAAVIRQDVIDWNKFPLEVGSLLDLYIAYLCSRTGRGAYYCAKRLTYNRVHSQSDTMLSGSQDAQAKIRKAQSQLFCYQVFMSDENFREYKPYFLKQWLHANTTLGIGLMRTGQTEKARPYFWQALQQQKFNFRTLAALFLSFTPKTIASRF